MDGKGTRRQDSQIFSHISWLVILVAQQFRCFYTHKPLICDPAQSVKDYK